MSEELNLLNLPRDVIRTIVKVGLEDVDSMFDISPTWYGLSKECLDNRAQLPVLKTLRWTIENSRSILTISIPERFRNYFGVTRWEYRSVSTGPLHNYFFDLTPGGRRLPYGGVIKISNLLGLIFRRCSRITKVDLDYSLTDDMIDANYIRNVIRGIVIDQLVCSAVHLQPVQAKILKLIEACQVGCLVFIFYPFCTENFDAFLPAFITFLSRVPSIELICGDFDDEPKVPQQFTLRHQVPIPNMQQHMLNFILRVEDNTRVGFHNITDLLNTTGQVSATFNEETFPSGRARFRIVLRL